MALPFPALIDAVFGADPQVFRSAIPFPHIILDDLLDPGLVDALHRNVEATASNDWVKHDEPGIEVKWRSNWQSEYCIPEPARDLVRFLNSGPMLRALTALTGIEHLIADPYYTGGGFNRLGRGGLLDVHVDGNWHDAMAVRRRLNLIVYLNRQWREEWGGQLRLYDASGASEVASIAPKGGRIVIFETDEATPHGCPQPVACPADQARTSIILYYYTASRTAVPPRAHSAWWRSLDWTDKRGDKMRGAGV